MPTVKVKAVPAHVPDKWSPLQLEVLTQRIEEYKTSGTLHGQDKKEARKVVLAAVFKDLKPLYPRLKKELWEQVKSNVKAWFNLNARSCHAKAPYVGKMKWTMQRVVGHVLKSEREAWSEKPVAWMLPTGSAKVVKGLDAEEKHEYQQIADQWNREGLPDDIRRKNVEKGGRCWMQEMAKHGWKAFGMRMIIFEAHYNKQNEAVHATHDFNDRLGTTPIGLFVDQDHEAQDAFEHQWASYAYSALLCDAGRSEEEGAAAVGIRRRLPAEVMELQSDRYGLPIIPPVGNMKGGDLNLLIRSFLTIHYRLVSGKQSIRPPWLQITENQEDYVSAEYIPELFTLQEPSRMKVSEKTALLDFWRARQNHPGMKYTFLWTAYHDGEHMVPNEYAMHSDDAVDSDRLVGKKPKKGKWKGKRKGKTASKPLKTTETTADDGNSDDSEPAEPVMINTTLEAKIVRKGKSKATVLQGPESQPLETQFEQAGRENMDYDVEAANSSGQVAKLVTELQVQTTEEKTATTTESESSVESESELVDRDRPVNKKLTKSKGKGKGKAKTASKPGKKTKTTAKNSNTQDIEPAKPVFTDIPIQAQTVKKGKSKATVLQEPTSQLVEPSISKGSGKDTKTADTHNYHTDMAADNSSSNSESDSDASTESDHSSDSKASSESDSSAESIIPSISQPKNFPKTKKPVEKKSVVIKKPKSSKPMTEMDRPTGAAKSAGRIDVVEDLTGVSRTRTPSRKRLEMAAAQEIVPTPVTKRKRKSKADLLPEMPLSTALAERPKLRKIRRRVAKEDNE